MLSEELIKIGKTSDGIKYAKKAYEIQQNCFMGVVNSEVQETMLLLAEIYSLNADTVDQALQFYTEILDAKADFEDTADIYRKMAPLYTQKKSYGEAISCLQNVLKTEHDQLL